VKELGGSVPRQQIITLESVIMDLEIQGHDQTAKSVQAILDAFKAPAAAATGHS
jgi:hypothetical protein